MSRMIVPAEYMPSKKNDARRIHGQTGNWYALGNDPETLGNDGGWQWGAFQTPKVTQPKAPVQAAPRDTSADPSWWAGGQQASPAPVAPPPTQPLPSMNVAPRPQTNPMIQMLSAGGGTTQVSQPRALANALRAKSGV